MERDPDLQVFVGATVHYVSFGTPGGEYESQCRAATVAELVAGPTDITPARVALVVHNPKGTFYDPNLPQAQGKEERVGGTWHWPDKHCPTIGSEWPK